MSVFLKGELTGDSIIWSPPCCCPSQPLNERSAAITAGNTTLNRNIMINQQRCEQQRQINDGIGKSFACHQVGVMTINLPGMPQENCTQHDCTYQVNQTAHLHGER